MEEERITLDKDSFRALASDTRVSILKSLGRRRKMLTELSKQLSMSPSTVKEHMDNLVRAGLVVQIDDGHKWKYYELTRKGENVLHPEDTKIWIILSVSIIGMIASIWNLAGGLFRPVYMASSFSATGGEMLERAPGMAQKVMDEAAPTVDTIANNVLPPAPSPLPLLQIAGILIFGVMIALCAYKLAKR